MEMALVRLYHRRPHLHHHQHQTENQIKIDQRKMFNRHRAHCHRRHL